MAASRWIDVLDKALIPITGIIVTAGLAWSQDLEHKRQACLDSQMSLIQFVCADKDNQCKPTPERAGHVPQVLQLVKTRCGPDFPKELTDIAITATGAAGDADATAKLSVQSGQKLTKPVVVAASAAPDLAPRTNDPTSPNGLEKGAETLGPRVYIQIQSEDQRAAAEQFRQAVNNASLNGMSIVAPGVQLVPGSRVTATELRCVTKADCTLAPTLASFLGVLLQAQTNLPVRDLSARYEGKGGTRPNHFELWFGPGAIRLSSAVSSHGSVVMRVDQTILPAGSKPPGNPNLF